MKFPRWTDTVLLPLSLQLALWPARCCAQTEAPEILSKAARDDVFARGAVSFPGGIVGFHGIEFANLVGYRPIELGLYRSAQPGPKPPLVIWVHGGGWVPRRRARIGCLQGLAGGLSIAPMEPSSREPTRPSTICSSTLSVLSSRRVPGSRDMKSEFSRARRPFWPLASGENIDLAGTYEHWLVGVCSRTIHSTAI
jgi:hypothetical protein